MKQYTVHRQLTPKQRAFVDEYLVDCNVCAAAKRAGYSPKSIHADGYKLLRKPHVMAAVREAMDERSRRTRISADKVLDLLARMAFFDVRQLFDEEGRLKPVAEWPEEASSAVAGMDVAELPGKGGVVRKVKFADKRAAAADLGKHLGMFAEKPEKKETEPPKVELIVHAPQTAPQTE